MALYIYMTPTSPSIPGNGEYVCYNGIALHLGAFSQHGLHNAPIDVKPHHPQCGECGRIDITQVALIRYLNGIHTPHTGASHCPY